jgi:hypothetical protein
VVPMMIPWALSYCARTLYDGPTTTAPPVPELEPLLEEPLLDVEDGDDPVAVPDFEDVEEDEEDETKGFESEEIEALERSKSN